MTRRAHGLIGGLSLGVILFSVLLTPGPESVSLFGWELPGTCAWKEVLGLRCPGCGLTRSFAYMGALEIGAAFQQNWLGPVGWVVVGAQVPFRGWRVRAPRVREGRP